MLESLTQSRPDQFWPSARAYKVRYVALPSSQRAVASKARWAKLERVFTARRRKEGTDLYQLPSDGSSDSHR